MTIDPRNYMVPTDLLRDRVILITGAGDGIGKAVALACAQHGATLILLGRKLKKLEAVYDEIVAAGGPQPGIATMDLLTATGDAYEQLAKQLQETFGRIDGLLHNASILGQPSPIEHHEIKTWLEVMHVNLTAPFILTQTMLPLLKASADASVIFTTSSVGRRGRAFWGAYAVSKFGTEGLAQILADETGNTDHIRVNCINPGATRTAMRRAAYPGEDPVNLRTPDQITGPYLWLLGRDSTDVSGQSFDCQ